MSIELQANAAQLLRVRGIEVKAVMNGDIQTALHALGDPMGGDFGYANWQLESDTLMKFPGYPYWRSFGSYVQRTNRAEEGAPPNRVDTGVVISFNAGSSSEFRMFFEAFCSEHNVEYEVV